MPRRSPDEKDMYDRLGPSRFSARGFLGNDARELEEIVAADALTLECIGLNREQFVRALRAVYNMALQSSGDPVEIASGVWAECLECRGKVPSPFPGEGIFPKHQVLVRGKKDKDAFTLTALSLHLIEKHGFFQGVGSPFRVDPALAAAMLDLAGGKSTGP